MSSKVKDEIIRVSLKMFARDGFFKARMDDIARAAGIAKGTVYHYFASKDELIAHSVRHISDQIIEIFSEGNSLREKLAGVVEFFKEDPEALKIFFDAISYSFRKKGKKTREIIKETFKQVKQQIVSALKAESIPCECSSIVIFHFLGLLVTFFVEEADTFGSGSYHEDIDVFIKLLGSFKGAENPT